jgi:hypothetical protein
VLKRSKKAHIISVENKKNQKIKINEETAREFSYQEDIQYFKADSTSKAQFEKIFDFFLN